MSRICPSCKNKLGAKDKYFCTKCGEALPSNLVGAQPPEKKIIHTSDDSQKSKVALLLEKRPVPNVSFLSHFFLGVGVTLLFVGVTTLSNFVSGKLVTMILGERISKSLSLNNNLLLPSKPKPVQIINTESVFPAVDFSKYTFSDYAPYDSYLYFEGSDFTKFFNMMIEASTDYKSKFEKIGPLVAGSVDNPFAFYVLKSESGDDIYGLILKTKGVISSEKILDAGFSSFYHKEKSYLSIITDKSLKDDLEQISQGLEKSLSLNPQYVSSRKFLSKEGKFVIVAPSKIAKAFLYNLSSDKIPAEVFNLVDRFLESKFDSLVIN